MQLIHAILLTFASAISAQSSAASQIPSCADSCLQKAFQSVGCSETDTACTCGDKKSQITANATPCVLSSCSTEDALKVQSATNEICSSAASGSDSSSAAPSSTSEASSSPSEASSSASEASSTASEVSSSASEASASASETPCHTSDAPGASGVSSSNATATAGGAASTSTASSDDSSSGVATETSSSTSSSPSSTASTEPFDGAANKAHVGIAMLVGAALLAAAL